MCFYTFPCNVRYNFHCTNVHNDQNIFLHIQYSNC